MTNASPQCKRGHAMVLLTTFRLDDEPGDSEADRVRLRELRRLGVELGAVVRLYYCAPCDEAQADFRYDDDRRG